MFSSPPHMSAPYNGYLGAQDWVEDIRPYSLDAMVAEIKARGLERGRFGLVTYGNVVAGNNLTYHDYQALTAALPEAVFTYVSRIIEDLRRIKSPEEIALLERSGAISKKVVDTMIETALPGVRENELYAAMIHTQLVEGAEPNIFILMSSGPMGGDGMSDFVLEKDMVFGTNIDIHNPRWRKDVGVMLGDTIHVTPSGGDVLWISPWICP